MGVDRIVLAALTDAYDQEVVDESKNDTRVVLHLHPALAPYKCAILPLSKKLSEQATALYQQLAGSFMCDYDESGSIGKRYRRQDEIGTPFCVTVTLRPNRTAVSLYGIGIPWTRCACPSRSWRPISRASWYSKAQRARFSAPFFPAISQ